MGMLKFAVALGIIVAAVVLVVLEKEPQKPEGKKSRDYCSPRHPTRNSSSFRVSNEDVSTVQSLIF